MPSNKVLLTSILTLNESNERKAELMKLLFNRVETKEWSNIISDKVSNIATLIKFQDSHLIEITARQGNINGDTVNIPRSAVLILIIANLYKQKAEIFPWILHELDWYPLEWKAGILKTANLRFPTLGFLTHLVSQQGTPVEMLPPLPNTVHITSREEDNDSYNTYYQFNMGDLMLDGEEVENLEGLLIRYKENLDEGNIEEEDVRRGREDSIYHHEERIEMLAKANKVLFESPTDQFDRELVQQFFGVYNHEDHKLLLTEHLDFVQQTRESRVVNIPVEMTNTYIGELARASKYFLDHDLIINQVEFANSYRGIRPVITNFKSKNNEAEKARFLARFDPVHDKELIESYQQMEQDLTPWVESLSWRLGNKDNETNMLLGKIKNGDLSYFAK